MERAMALRERMLCAESFSFEATVTADYGDYFHTFVLACHADQEGTMSFQVLAPDSIAGITGEMDQEQGRLTFDNEILAFSPLADGMLAPVTAPWLLIHTLRGGYLSACGETDQGLLLTIDDSYADDALTLQIQLDHRDLPDFAEVIWQGRRILTIQLENFELV